MFFTSIKEIYSFLSKGINRLRKEISRLLSKGMNRSRKEINRLLSKGMSNICLKVPFEKNWRSQTFDFLILENLTPGRFWGAPTHADVIDF